MNILGSVLRGLCGSLLVLSYIWLYILCLPINISLVCPSSASVCMSMGAAMFLWYMEWVENWSYLQLRKNNNRISIHSQLFYKFIRHKVFKHFSILVLSFLTLFQTFSINFNMALEKTCPPATMSVHLTTFFLG